MAMIKFWRGNVAPASRDADTLYFVKDNGHLYLGNDLIADVTKLDTTQVEQILGDALSSYYTKSAIDGIVNTINGDIAKKVDQTAYDTKIGAIESAIAGKADASTAALKTEVQAVDAKFADYTKTADLGDLALKDSLTAGEVGAYTKEEVNSAISTATKDMATNASVDQKLASYRTSAAQDVIDQAQDKALADYKAEMVETLKGYDTIGSAQAAKEAAIKHTDDIVAQYLTGEGAADTIDTLSEIADWINNDEAGATKIIADVAKNTQAIADEKTAREEADKTITGDIDAIELQLNGIAAGDGSVKAAIDAALAAAKKYADDNDANTVYDDKEVRGLISGIDGRVGAIESKLPDGTIADTDDITNAINGVSSDIAKGVTAHGWGNHAEAGYAVAADIEGSLAKAESAVQPSAIADMLTKTEAGNTYQPKGNYEAAGAAAAVQGGTTNTVKDCVDAINTMNNQVGDTVGTVNNIVSMLTWIEG